MFITISVPHMLCPVASIEVSQVIPIKVMGKEGGSLKSKGSTSSRGLHPGEIKIFPFSQTWSPQQIETDSVRFCVLLQILLFVQTSRPIQSPLIPPVCTGKWVSPSPKTHRHTTGKEGAPRKRTSSSFNLRLLMRIRRRGRAHTDYTLSLTRWPKPLPMECLSTLYAVLWWKTIHIRCSELFGFSCTFILLFHVFVLNFCVVFFFLLFFFVPSNSTRCF